MKQLRIFQLCINFVTVILINFLLLLRKGVYPYQDMDSWEKFDETLITPKGAFTLNQIQKISQIKTAHVQNVWEVFKIENCGEYHDLYVQCNTLLLADMFENVRDKCIEIYELNPAYFLTALGLAWQACLKKQE